MTLLSKLLNEIAKNDGFVTCTHIVYRETSSVLFSFVYSGVLILNTHCMVHLRNLASDHSCEEQYQCLNNANCTISPPMSAQYI